MKRTYALLMALLLLCLAACSGGQKPNSDGTPSYYHIADKDTTCELIYPENTLSAADIYGSMTYTPQMFYGHYELNGSSEKQLAASLETGTMEVSYFDYELVTRELTTIPYSFTAGAASLSHVITRCAPEYNWMRMYFYRTDSETLTYFLGAYEVTGTQLSFRPLTAYAYDEATDTAEYTLSDAPLVYDSSFKGPQLILSANEKSLTLNTWDTITEDRNGDKEDPRLHANCYLTAGSASLAGIEQFSLLSTSDEPKNNYFSMKHLDGTQTYSNYTAAKLDTDGLLTICWTDRESGEMHTVQAVAFWCYNDGLVLSDGTTNYYYNDSFWVHYENLLGSNLSEEDREKLENLPESTIEDLEEKRTSLFDDLAAAFDAAGLNVAVDKTTGEIRLDSAVLFGVDQSDLTAGGEEFLATFLKVYADVTFSDTYEGFVSKILVEGHTDTQGDYDYNLQLSQARADSVLQWCISDANTLDASVRTQLDGLLEAVGCSYDKPVYDTNGEVDMEASRRVSFRFMISIG